MAQVNIQEAKTQLSRLLVLVESGEEVVIARYGKPIAKLVSLASPVAQRVPGTWQGDIDIADDFDDEIPEAWMAPLEPACWSPKPRLRIFRS